VNTVMNLRPPRNVWEILEELSDRWLFKDSIPWSWFLVSGRSSHVYTYAWNSRLCIFIGFCDVLKVAFLCWPR
jgi:hypothetical protein